jgi:ABC-type iron transport system FetAB permease component
MNDDDLKQLWQQQPIPATGDVSALVAEARLKHGKFQRTIFWRDFREAGLAIVMIPIWLRGAVHHHTLWTHYLMVPVMLFIAGFLIIDRLRRRKKAVPPDGTVVESLTAAADDVQHQIWLLGNVQWWYVGPICGALVAETIQKLAVGYLSLDRFIFSMSSNLLLALGVWWLNHSVVKRYLKPRRDELHKLLAEL